MKKPAVFLDRDGTIFTDTGYPGDSSSITFLPGADEALKLLQSHFLLIIISNQSGVGRGILTKDEWKRVHQRMMTVLLEHAITITDSFYCLHSPDDDCDCRKPEPKMILDAARKWDVDLQNSFMTGDKMSDAEAGCRAGCVSILLDDGKKRSEKINRAGFPDIIVPDLLAAGKWILNQTDSVDATPDESSAG